MRLPLIVGALLLSSCAISPSAVQPSIPGDLAALLIRADLNVTDPAVNRKVSRGAVVSATLDDCLLSLTPVGPPAAPLTIDLSRLLFLYEDDHDNSIGLVQAGRGQPAISFFTDQTRYAETLRAFESAAAACGSNPDRFEPLVSLPIPATPGMPGTEAPPRGG